MSEAIGIGDYYKQTRSPFGQQSQGTGGGATAGLGPTLNMVDGSYQTDFWSPEQWQQFGSEGGTIGDNGSLMFGSGGAEGGGAMDWLGQNSKGLGTAMQGIGLGASLYNTFFGDGAKMNKKNMQLMDQKIASNKKSMKARDDFNKSWATASNKVSGLGSVA